MVSGVSGVNTQPMMKMSMDDINKKSRDITDGAKKVEDTAKNIEKAVTTCATAATASAGSIIAASKVFKPFIEKAKAVAGKQEIQEISQRLKGITDKSLKIAKNNPKKALIALGIMAASITAIVLGKALIKAKSEKAAAQPAEKPEAQPAEKPAKKLDIVSES